MYLPHKQLAAGAAGYMFFMAMNKYAHGEDDPGEFTPELCAYVLRYCGSFNLRKAARAVTQLYDDILQPTGLRSTQLVLLVALAVDPELSLARLARELVLSPSTLSRNIQPLERDGLVETYPTGKRGRYVRLTPRGKEVLIAAVPYWRKAQESFTRRVGAQSWEEMTERLNRTIAATLAS